MADQELRDKSNRLLGRIKTLSNGKLELRDHTNSLKGTYDPKTNETRDKSNSLVGKGNSTMDAPVVKRSLRDIW